MGKGDWHDVAMVPAGRGARHRAPRPTSRRIHTSSIARSRARSTRRSARGSTSTPTCWPAASTNCESSPRTRRGIAPRSSPRASSSPKALWRTAAPALASDADRAAVACDIAGSCAPHCLRHTRAFRVSGRLTEIDGEAAGGRALDGPYPAVPPEAERGDRGVDGSRPSHDRPQMARSAPGFRLGASRTVQVMREAGDGLAARRGAQGRDRPRTGNRPSTCHADPQRPIGGYHRTCARLDSPWGRARRARSARARPMDSGRNDAPLGANDSSGRFRLAYRFRRTFQTSTYRFRVVAARTRVRLHSRREPHDRCAGEAMKRLLIIASAFLLTTARTADAEPVEPTARHGPRALSSSCAPSRPHRRRRSASSTRA